MTDSDASLTLAIILTAAGAVATSAFVTGLVQMLKVVLGSLLEGRERLAAFAISAVLVVLAYVAGLQDATITFSLPTVFAAFVAWYGIARLSMAHYADATRETNSLTGPEENRPGGGD